MSSRNSDDYDEEDLHDYLFSDVRNDLNLDMETLEDSWNTFKQINSKYILEGPKLDWLVCALYSSCRKSVTQSVGNKQTKIEGNMVSVTRILRTCQISFLRFFKKMKNWIDMANLPQDMVKKRDQLEQSFNVTSVVFRKYKTIFEDLFKCHMNLPCRFILKNKKQIRKQPMNANDVFTFCWTLFIFIKSRYSTINEDLVNSYHLLLACIDYCYTNILSFVNFRDIVNTNFYEEKIKILHSENGSTINNDNRISIIDILCEKWAGIAVEVRQIRKYWFKSLINELADNKKLRKRANGIIDLDVIDSNYKYIKREYEENYVLKVGDFDECIFLNESASRELGTAELQTTNIDEKLFSRTSQSNQASVEYDQSQSLVFATPLSSKQYLNARTPSSKLKLSPISSATVSISRLQSILVSRKNEPSKELSKLFEKCAKDPRSKIEEILKKMGDIFIEAYSKEGNESSVIKSTEEYQCILTSGKDFASKRLEFAICFFYYILEKILFGELRSRVPETQIFQEVLKMVETDIFIRSLFACSLEIVLFCYSPCGRVFPWILELYNSSEDYKIHSFHFYKVIEPIIRAEPVLSREIVKHLNCIEESILSSFAWEADSPIWVLLSKYPAPTCSQVSLNILNNSEKRDKRASILNTPVKLENSGMMNAYLTMATPQQIAVAKKLFVNNENSPKLTAQPSQIIKYKTENDFNDKNSTLTSPLKIGQKNSQLSLFFRKVYAMASFRLRDFFERLEIRTDELQLKIWTCFEYALSQHTDLMINRHLDQIIMSSIFGVCKICKFPILFQKIIEFYRSQPQFVNTVYRSVLLNRSKSAFAGVDEASNETENLSITSTGTIIDFYNSVFIPELTENYMMKFSPNEKISPTLSLMPRNRIQSPIKHSPRRCVQNQVFVSPLRSTLIPPSPNKMQISHRFQNDSNTSKDLKIINNMMKSAPSTINLTPTNNNVSSDMKASIATAMISMAMVPSKRVAKRILQDDQEDINTNDDSPSNKSSRIMNRKIQEIQRDRQQYVSAAAASAVSPTVTTSVKNLFNVLQPKMADHDISEINNNSNHSQVNLSDNNGISDQQTFQHQEHQKTIMDSEMSESVTTSTTDSPTPSALFQNGDFITNGSTKASDNGTSLMIQNIIPTTVKTISAEM